MPLIEQTFAGEELVVAETVLTIDDRAGPFAARVGAAVDAGVGPGVEHAETPIIVDIKPRLILRIVELSLNGGAAGNRPRSHALTQNGFGVFTRLGDFCLTSIQNQYRRHLWIGSVVQGFSAARVGRVQSCVLPFRAAHWLQTFMKSADRLTQHSVALIRAFLWLFGDPLLSTDPSSRLCPCIPAYRYQAGAGISIRR
jgi:hypothetical protein